MNKINYFLLDTRLSQQGEANWFVGQEAISKWRVFIDFATIAQELKRSIEACEKNYLLCHYTCAKGLRNATEGIPWAKYVGHVIHYTGGSSDDLMAPIFIDSSSVHEEYAYKNKVYRDTIERYSNSLALILAAISSSDKNNLIALR